jgi:DNA-binding NarL/FixJ family response regulator
MVQNLGPSASSVAILIVDDHPLILEGMCRLLEEAGFAVVGQAASAREAVEKVRLLRPGVVILDVRLPDQDGLWALRQIKSQDGSVAVIMISAYEDPEYLWNAAVAGAAGYFLKGAAARICSLSWSG